MSWFSKQWEDLTTHGPGGAIADAVGDTGKVLGKIGKNYGSGVANFFTLGVAGKYTGVGKWSGTKTARKIGTSAGIGAAVIAGGVAGYTALTPSAGEASLFVAEQTAGESIATGYASGEVLEAAAGSGVAWAEPGVSASGILASITGGVKSTAEILGLTGIARSLFGTVAEAGQTKVHDLIDRQVSSIFSGSSETSGGPEGTAGGSGGTLSMIPYIIIFIVLIGIFIKRKKGVSA